MTTRETLQFGLPLAVGILFVWAVGWRNPVYSKPQFQQPVKSAVSVNTDRLKQSVVHVAVGETQGSGVLVQRPGHTFVVTVAHVLEDVNATTPVVISQELTIGARLAGRKTTTAVVIRLNVKEDLAVLELPTPGFMEGGEEFLAEGAWLEPGKPVIHVGNWMGNRGIGSLSTGVISHLDRRLDGSHWPLLDQVTATLFPGSSGGPVYDAEAGRVVGIVVATSGQTWSYMVPSRQVWAWARKEGLLWLVDPAVPVPKKLNGSEGFPAPLLD